MNITKRIKMTTATLLIMCFPAFTYGQGEIFVKDREAIRKLQKQIENQENQIKKLEEIIKNAKGDGGVSNLNTEAFTTKAKEVLEQAYSETAPTLGAESAKKYLGEKNPCQGKGVLYEICVAVRNTKAAMIAEQENYLKLIDKRVQAVNKLINRSQQKDLTPGQLQALQSQINAYQALLQTDAMRYKTTLGIYQQRLALYQQQHTDIVNKVLYGSGKSGGPTGAVNIMTGLIK